ncbi:MAG TPA: flagellar hook-length control protein FliK [Candidatus Saccharimonadales bacterium]|nr:flagellar hook-length control protein FliK [Candidatus Saccharimonadales bacterium]
MAAHAVHTKATAPSQGTQPSAVPADEASLFADLLSQTGDAKSDAGASNPETLLVAHRADGKAKRDKDAADAVAPGTADIQIQPSQLAVLSASLSATGDKAPASKDTAANDNGDVGDTDQSRTAALLNRMLAAKTDAPSGKNIPAKDTGKKDSKPGDVAADPVVANAGAAVTANAADTAGSKAANDKLKVADVGDGNKPQTEQAKDTTAQTDAATSRNVAVQQAVEQVAKTPQTAESADAPPADSKPDAKTASKDAAAQASIPHKAAALAAVADKSVRQNVASQSTQARALPVQADTQIAANGKTGGDADTGDKNSSQTSAHAKNDSVPQANTDSTANADAVQPAASQAPLNTANATQPAAHAPVQTGNVQPVTAQAQTQTSSPIVTASLQVAPQTTQSAAQPDVTGLAVQIAAKSDEGVKHFDIRLDPPELGRVDVKLSIDDAGQAQAHLAVEKPQTLDMLQNDRSNLERALKDSGVNLSQNGLNFSLKGQEKQGGDNPQSFRGRSRALAATAAIESATAAAATASSQSIGAANARLDIVV